MTNAGKSNTLLSNLTYDRLKFLVQIVIPAVSALYVGLAQIWGFPNVEQVAGTLAVIAVFLGTVLRISVKSYSNSQDRFDGTLVIDTSNDDTDVYSLEVDTPLSILNSKNELTVKVSHR